MNTNEKSRSTFSGKIGYVLAVAGSAVGLGNIWRFPYLAAKYGGGMFLLVYLVLMLTFGYTMIMAETTLGRMTRKSPVGAFSSFGRGKLLKAGGWMNAIVPVLIVPGVMFLLILEQPNLSTGGSILICALVMLKSGYHSYKKATRFYHLLIPAIPALAVSVIANAVNFSKIGSDYMFFKLNSFFFAPIGAATPDWFSVILVYFIYLLIHALPYLPFYIYNKTNHVSV